MDKVITPAMLSVLETMKQGHSLCVIEENRKGIMAYTTQSNGQPDRGIKVATVQALRRRRLISLEKSIPGSHHQWFKLTRSGWKAVETLPSKR